MVMVGISVHTVARLVRSLLTLTLVIGPRLECESGIGLGISALVRKAMSILEVLGVFRGVFKAYS